VRLLALCLVAVCVALAGCGGSDERGPTTQAASPPAQSAQSAPPAEPATEWPIVDEQPAVLMTPGTPTDRVVLYVHGAGETAGSIVGDPAKGPLVQLLLDRGYAIAASDARGNNWGNPASLQDYAALVEWLAGRGLTRVYVLAQSMGGLDGLQLIDVARPVAWAGIYVVCNLRAVYDLGRFSASIQAAYAAPATGWAPSAFSPVVPQNVQGLPMMFWASPQDTEVPKATNTDQCAADAQAKGAAVTVVPTTGEHGDWSNFDPVRLVEFFDAAA
jgi:pimeloyl-ACP methyl ester carboxylesterase